MYYDHASTLSQHFVSLKPWFLLLVFYIFTINFPQLSDKTRSLTVHSNTAPSSREPSRLEPAALLVQCSLADIKLTLSCCPGLAFPTFLSIPSASFLGGIPCLLGQKSSSFLIFSLIFKKHISRYCPEKEHILILLNSLL